MKIREKIVVKLYGVAKHLYINYYQWNKQEWGGQRNDLARYADGSIGNSLHIFLTNNGFNLIPKHETHDLLHLVADIGTGVKDEIALQYFLLGNGKTSPFLYSSVVVGMCLLPEYMHYYKASWKRGKTANPIYNVDFEPILDQSFSVFKQSIYKNQSL